MIEQHNHEFQDRRAPAEQSWHLKKEINVSLIISVISIAVTMVMGYADLKREIALIQADAIVLHQRDSQQGNDTERALDLIRTQYERMEGKIDRLIERGSK
jgi:hypothetical protein